MGEKKETPKKDKNEKKDFDEVLIIKIHKESSKDYVKRKSKRIQKK